MRRLAKLLASAFIYFCAATVIAQGMGLTFLWMRGNFTKDKATLLLAIAHDIDVVEVAARLRAEENETPEEQVSHQEIVQARLAKSLDLDLRDQVIDKGLDHLRLLEDGMTTMIDRFDRRRQEFEKELEKLTAGNRESAVANLQRQIEVMQPSQAKDQLLRMPEDAAMSDVVTIIMAMPPSKTKKIYGEFKNDIEAQKLADIFKQIRLGEPMRSLIEEAGGPATTDPNAP